MESEFVGEGLVFRNSRDVKKKGYRGRLRQENWQVHAGPRLIATSENRAGGGSYGAFVAAVCNLS